MGISPGPGGTKRKDKFSNKPKAKVSLKHLMFFSHERSAYASEASAAATPASRPGRYWAAEAWRAAGHPWQAWVKQHYSPLPASPWGLDSQVPLGWPLSSVSPSLPRKASDSQSHFCLVHLKQKLGIFHVTMKVFLYHTGTAIRHMRLCHSKKRAGQLLRHF